MQVCPRRSLVICHKPDNVHTPTEWFPSGVILSALMLAITLNGVVDRSQDNVDDVLHEHDDITTRYLPGDMPTDYGNA